MSLAIAATNSAGQSSTLNMSFQAPRVPPPRFTAPTGALSLSNSLSVGDSLTKVQATGDGVSYSLEGPDAQYFAIDSESG